MGLIVTIIKNPSRFFAIYGAVHKKKMYHHEGREKHEGYEFETIYDQANGCLIELHRFLCLGLLKSTYLRCLSR